MRNTRRRDYDDSSSDSDQEQKKRRNMPRMPNFDNLNKLGNINLLDMVDQHGMDFNIAKIDKMMDNSKLKSQRLPNMIPGQMGKSLEALKIELIHAKKQRNVHLQISLLETIIHHKDIEKKEMKEFQNESMQLLFKNKREMEALQMLKVMCQKDIFDVENLKLRILMAQCLLKKNDTFTGFLCVKRAEAIKLEILSKFRGEEERKEEISEVEFLDESGVKDLEGLVEQYRLRVISAEERKFDIMIAGKSINGVLGQGKKDVQNKGEISLLSIPELTNRKVISVACGDFHTLAVVSGYLPSAKIPNIADKTTYFDGTDIFGWGENGCGQIHGNDIQQIVSQPQIIAGFIGKDVIGVAACKSSSTCYTKGNEVFSWGYRHRSNSFSIEKEQEIPDDIIDLQRGVECKFVLTKSKKIFFFGEILYNENKIAVSGKKAFEIQGKGLESKDVRGISCGHNHLLVMGKKNKVYAFGNNEFGQLGIEQEISYWNKLEEIKYFSEKDYISAKKVNASHNISLVVDEQDEVYIWGWLNEKILNNYRSAGEAKALSEDVARSNHQYLCEF